MREINITFDVASRRLAFGMQACASCHNNGERGIPAGREITFGHKPCGACKGTGKRGNGRCRKCEYHSRDYVLNRLPVGNVPDYDAPRDGGPCKSCDGTAEELATSSDSVPSEVMAQITPTYMPVRVYARPGGLSIGERLLGIMPSDSRLVRFALMSVTDYGAGASAYAADAEAWLAQVTAKIVGERAQACKLADESGLVADHWGVFLASNGYTISAVLPDPSLV